MKKSSLNKATELGVSHNPKIRKRVLISSGEIAKVTQFSQAVFPPGEVAHAHSHSDMTEVFFIESGEGTMIVDDNIIPLHPGVCITISPNEVHELRNTSSKELVVSYFGIET